MSISFDTDLSRKSYFFHNSWKLCEKCLRIFTFRICCGVGNNSVRILEDLNISEVKKYEVIFLTSVSHSGLVFLIFLRGAASVILSEAKFVMESHEETVST